MSDAAVDRLKRLHMRSWRRGTKEMDLILGPYADAHLAAMGAGALDLYEALLGENDQDLYPWITGAAAAPERFAGLLAEIGAFARSRHGAAKA
ncbi:succinate dehydrogenase assembly factor 2 [Frigidibacter sp. RF13]|uniref:FAD assembly factor SdhE n=1 Tax=Frigidibacter sp. RF13 TaxID=2997340 RepID=UPI0022708BC6|nr:succinate dehydrogenase assembly factor 2 [Frigidibacter sp. RF13]MCY1128419.1 succinate dehydrogenase assembly factor 2 [Frigidibacter sp. RF13]